LFGSGTNEKKAMVLVAHHRITTSDQTIFIRFVDSTGNAEGRRVQPFFSDFYLLLYLSSD